MSLPYATSLDEIKVKIREHVQNPNVGRSWQAVLKEGPRAFRLATMFEIVDPNTKQRHHCALRIDSMDRQKKRGWFHQPERTVTLEGSDPDEIDRLFCFLQAHLDGKLDAGSELHIVKADEYEKLANLLGLIPSLAAPDMVELLKLILPRIEGSKDYLREFIQAFTDSDPTTVEHFGIAARVVKHRRDFEELRSLVSNGTASEQAYQELLSRCSWMFGSEYSELLSRRTWSRDDNVDFMLRRTSDNYLEVIEIKTPFAEPLFLHDRSHDSYYPSSRLSPVLGQVMRYISELERDRDTIRSKDGCDSLKIRARVIIGRDGNEGQCEALRNLNGHLHRIEVITFDQLVRIASRVLNVFEEAAQPVDDDASIPF